MSWQKKCGYEYFGEDREVTSIRFSHCADKDSIAIANCENEIEKTEAMCVLTQPTMFCTEKSLVFASDPLEFAAVKAAQILYGDLLYEINGLVAYKKIDHYYCGKNVVIGKNTYIAPNVCIGNNVVIGEGCIIEMNVKIGSNTCLGNHVHISNGSSIGANSFYHFYDHGLQQFSGVGKTMINDNVHIGSNTIVQRGTFSDTYIGSNSQIGNLIDIGHDVYIGDNCKIVSQTGIAGNVRIESHVQIFGQSGIANHVHIGNYSVVMAKSLVTKNVKDHKTVSGIYARDHYEELKTQVKIRKL